MKGFDKIVLYGALLIVIITLVLAIKGSFQKDIPGGFNKEEYQKALSAELNDICATPQGYSDEAWKQHMSHHPDRYEGCLD